MQRQEKYPDTDTFRYYNANPHNRKGGDCTIRAICTALEQTWEQTVREMTEVGIEKGFVVNDPTTIKAYLKQKGWVICNQPRKGDGTKFTGKEFCRRITGEGSTYIANIGGHHIVAIVDSKVNDIWDSTEGCIGNYWIKGCYAETGEIP